MNLSFLIQCQRLSELPRIELGEYDVWVSGNDRLIVGDAMVPLHADCHGCVRVSSS